MSILKNSEKVIIASKNQIKINTVTTSFAKVFPEQEFEFVGISASSEVSDQPMTEAETSLGAKNRIKNAKASYPDADFWVALEGGLQEVNGQLEVFGYIVVETTNKTGISKTATFTLPEKVAELIRQGKELGEADDIVFGGINSKQKTGAVGILTKNLITRTTYYEQAMILALIPFINLELY